jgi:L-threonylcarbamoyladenylate synthase
LISDWGVATDPSARRPGFLAYRALPAGLAAGPTARILSPTGDPAEAAHNLYDALIALDAAGCDRLFVELPPDEGLGAVMRERLGRMGREGEETG